MKILIIDDDKLFLLLLQGLLESEEYELFFASDQQEGIALFDALLPDLVLLDDQMPGLSGKEVAPILKAAAAEQKKFVPILFFSSTKNVQDLIECIDSGADDLISKPLFEKLLEAKLRMWWRKSQLINAGDAGVLPNESPLSSSPLSEEALQELFSDKA